jgi:hypothetical protein
MFKIVIGLLVALVGFKAVKELDDRSVDHLDIMGL